jgi:hypothetical protein
LFRRLNALIGAVAFGGAATIGLLSGTAHADPICPDVHWMGAAGSGERTGADLTANAGMGRVVYDSYRDFSQLVQRDGRTITAEAVEYPAVAVPPDGDIMGWSGFIGSVDTGMAALDSQYASFVARCPNTKVVLAGYSQGAMVVHRSLAGLAESPNLGPVLLVADGYRMPENTTVKMGTVTTVPGAGMGVAQDWPILSHAPNELLPVSVGSRTIDVCDLGDPVCDYDPDAEEDVVSPAAVAIHTSYALARSEALDWTEPLYQLLGPTPAARELVQAGS